jgi:hypothetical protein
MPKPGLARTRAAPREGQSIPLNRPSRGEMSGAGVPARGRPGSVAGQSALGGFLLDKGNLRAEPGRKTACREDTQITVIYLSEIGPLSGASAHR